MLGIQVASREGARNALRHNPDFLICQAVEAGGHVQANDPMDFCLREVLAVAGNTPVVAAGGIATGADIRRVLNAGASGVVMGTRIVATKESDLHAVYKQAIVDSKENDTVFTNCFNRGWNAMHRVLKNSTYTNWEAAGCPLENRPGENDVVAKNFNGKDILRYAPTPPIEGATGDLKAMVMYAGTGAKDIHDVPSVAELIPRIWKEFEG